MLVQIKDFQYFVAAYDTKSFSRASCLLDTVQSNVSLRIRRLEEVLGVLLFERRPRCVVPTVHADMLYPSAVEALQAFDHARHVIAPRAPVRHSDGFTLLELLVVIVIIGLLAAYVAPKYFSQIGRSEVQVVKAQIDAFEKALDQFRLDTRHYPSTEQGLKALVERPSNEPNWNGPYLRKAVPLDPWGKPYTYRAPGTKGEFDLVSFGKDGQAGGSGENADIANY